MHFMRYLPSLDFVGTPAQHEKNKISHLIAKK